MTRSSTTRPGTVRFVGGGPGNAGMLTCRARDVLAGTAVVYVDADVPEDVLRLVAGDVPVPQELLDERQAAMDEAVASEDKAEIKRLKNAPAPTSSKPVWPMPAPASMP